MVQAMGELISISTCVIMVDQFYFSLTLLNICSIRDNAEQRVRNRLNHFNGIQKKRPDVVIGVVGCMAERLKSKQ
jgi:tRNA A37 methylthiotransferase MiaB